MEEKYKNILQKIANNNYQNEWNISEILFNKIDALIRERTWQSRGYEQCIKTKEMETANFHLEQILKINNNIKELLNV